MAQDRNTYAKRQRETQKRQKAQDKRARRQKKKELAADTRTASHEDRPAIDQGVPDPAGP
jgi:hypothetical protein